jgi:hypothetical protein
VTAPVSHKTLSALHSKTFLLLRLTSAREDGKEGKRTTRRRTRMGEKEGREGAAKLKFGD